MKNKEIFTKEQIKKFEKVADTYNSADELLIGLKAIKDVGYQRFIIQYEGLTGALDPITGCTFTNDFPYSLYQKLIAELEKKDRRKKYAEQMTIAHLEDTALTLNKNELF